MGLLMSLHQRGVAQTCQLVSGGDLQMLGKMQAGHFIGSGQPWTRHTETQD